MRPDWLKIIDGLEDDGELMDLMLDGTVGGGKVNVDAFEAYMNSLRKEKKVRLFLNSFGGYIDQGTAIYNRAKHRGNIDTVVAGYAASIMSVIAQAGETRYMMPGSLMIIHNPQLPTGGGEEKDLEMQLELIRKNKSNILDIYHDSTGLSRKRLSEMMDKTTVMTPDEAVEFGFADEIFDTSKMKNKITISPQASLSSVLRSVASLEAVSEGGEAKQTTTQKPKIMKSLTAALAAAGFLPSAEMTDEANIVTAFNSHLPKFRNQADVAKITELEGKVDKFEKAQKARIENKVKAAIETEKLVKAERKDFLTNMGVADEVALDNYLEDLRGMKGTAQTPAKPATRGAPPVPPEEKNDPDSKAEKITALQNELKTADSARRVAISRDLRELRGHNKLFASGHSEANMVPAVK